MATIAILRAFIDLFDVFRGRVLASIWPTRQEFTSNGTESTEGELYKYLPLGTTEIRLLQVVKRPFSGIHYNLVPEPLNNAPAYEAISYTWGTSAKADHITIDGKRLMVTRNVRELLEWSASVWHPTTLWIDSICINQADIGEKEQQVQLMRRIYERASEIIIWLGNPPESKNVVGFLMYLYYQLLSHDGSDDEMRARIERAGRAGRPWWPNLDKFFGHRYWSRVWIVQELAVAKTITIVYGGYPMPWAQFIHIFRKLLVQPWPSLLLQAQIVQPTGSTMNGQRHILTLASIRRRIQSESTIPLSEIMTLCSTSKATDVRDKVYALQGLVGTMAVIPDYSKSPTAVYQETARYILTHENSLNYLCLAGTGYGGREDFPSWAVDWEHRSNTAMPAPLGSTTSKLYRASSGSKQVPREQGSNQITLKGVMIDTIQDMGVQVTSFAADTHGDIVNQQLPEIFRWHQEAKAKAHASATVQDRYGQDLPEAFWRTLVGGVDHPTQPASPDLSQSYASWCRVHDFMHTRYSEIRRAADPPADELSQDAFAEAFENDVLRDMSSPAFARQFPQLSVDIQRCAGFTLAFGGCGARRKFATTRSGYMALVPPAAKIKDSVVIFLGASTPFVLRADGESVDEAGGGQVYRLVGECYVHGLMDGRVFDGEQEVRTFTLR
ncbi:hypothetical protein FGG08_006193 [Glutinoglossum americanum]|uniref:Heterokaryon incompatibility domain-containing protein n=1 Tax=Glutinoglossum americanum TaxID=1670608 RepID=A0A9P8HYT7_9PEZI|nr:hypothetical protein FGG08_006193 [Glutinoglossum americanum]